MNILMFSIDERVFEEGSEARERMRFFGSALDSLHLMVFTRSRREREAIAANVFLHPAPAALGLFSAARAVWLGSRILRDFSGNALITSQDAFTNVIAFLLRRFCRTPVQVQIHTDFLAPAFRSESLKNRLRYHLYCWSVRRADCVRVVSERIKRSLVFKLGVPEKTIAVLPVFTNMKKNASDPPAEDFKRKFIGAEPVVLWVGRLAKEKNPSLALEIFGEFAKEFPKSLLVIVGDGPEEKSLKSKVKNFGLEDRVRFEGWQNSAAPYYRTADFLLATSRYEGYGRMLIEAAAAGLPVVSTDVGIVGEVLKPNESVLIFRSRAEAADAIRRFARDKDLHKRIGEAGRRAVAGIGDSEQYRALFLAALRECRPELRRPDNCGAPGEV